MANNSSPDTRKRSGAQNADFKPSPHQGSADRGGGEKSQGREPITGASVGGTKAWGVIKGADGPDGTGHNTQSSSAFKPPKNNGGSSGATQKVGGYLDKGKISQP